MKRPTIGDIGEVAFLVIAGLTAGATVGRVLLNLYEAIR